MNGAKSKTGVRRKQRVFFTLDFFRYPLNWLNIWWQVLTAYLLVSPSFRIPQHNFLLGYHCVLCSKWALCSRAVTWYKIAKLKSKWRTRICQTNKIQIWWFCLTCPNASFALPSLAILYHVIAQLQMAHLPTRRGVPGELCFSAALSINFWTFGRHFRSFRDVKWPALSLCGRREHMMKNVKVCILIA